MNSAAPSLERLLSAPIEFYRRPVDVPAELRPAWRGAFLLLVLGSCRSKKAAIETIHFLSWAAGTADSRTSAHLALSTEGAFRFRSPLPVRFDLAVNRSLGYLTAERLVILDRGRYRLTERGERLVEQLRADACMFETEKSFLQSISPINDTRIRSIFQRG